MGLTPAAYRLVARGPWSVIEVPALTAAGVVHGFGLRGGGTPGQWAEAIDRDRVRPVTAAQVHGDRVQVVSARHEPGPCDGLITDEPDCLIGVFTADCLPILLVHPERHIVAAVHAGWRGLMLAIASQTVAAFVDRWAIAPSSLLVALGPCIGPCCFEVGTEVWQPLQRQVEGADQIVQRGPDRNADGRAMVDLQSWAARQLTDSGVPHERILAVELCTRCHPALFSSYRRDGRQKLEMFNGVMAGRLTTGAAGQSGH